MAIARRLTLDEFLALPEEKPALEYFEGRVKRKVSPKSRHSALQGALTSLFDAYAYPRRLARAFPELRCTYAGASLVPDIVVFSWDRIPAGPDGDLLDDVFVPPDLTVEIASPAQSRRSLAAKCQWYLEHGVRLALLVDPDARTIELFRSAGVSGPLRGDQRVDLDELLPGFELTPDRLFAALRAR
jgi:Uma2 family endonuclease